jgi:hypothetical protein
VDRRDGALIERLRRQLTSAGRLPMVVTKYLIAWTAIASALLAVDAWGATQESIKITFLTRKSDGIVRTRISQMNTGRMACDLRLTPETQGDSANSCHADRRTHWVTAKRAICGSVSTVL